MSGFSPEHRGFTRRFCDTPGNGNPLATFDEVPQHWGIGRVNRHESWPLDSPCHARHKVRNLLRPLAWIGRVPLGNDQRGSAPPISIGPMTCRTSLGDKELRTLRSGAVSRREVLAG